MRWLVLLIAATMPAGAEYVAMSVGFTGTGCASCTESLPGRLMRIRGVDGASVDAEKGRVRLDLAEDNRVRVSVVRARIEQDGTRVDDVHMTARGVFRKAEAGWQFETSGVRELFAVTLKGTEPEPGKEYEIEAAVTGFPPTGLPELKLETARAR